MAVVGGPRRPRKRPVRWLPTIILGFLALATGIHLWDQLMSSPFSENSDLVNYRVSPNQTAAVTEVILDPNRLFYPAPPDLPTASRLEHLQSFQRPQNILQTLEKDYYDKVFRRLKNLWKRDHPIVWERDANFLFPFNGTIVSTNEWKSGSDVKKIWESNSPFVYVTVMLPICPIAKIALMHMPKQRRPLVLFAFMDENVGLASEYIPNHTYEAYGGRPNAWARVGGCSLKRIAQFLADSRIRAVITTQWHAGYHPKLFSIPIGYKPDIEGLIKEFYATRTSFEKSQLLMINDSGWRHRANATRQVVSRFERDGITLKNTYCYPPDGKKCPMKQKQLYIEELARSKFIMAPYGFGPDCYRIWEALSLGTIPIIETLGRVDGWRQTLKGLPVLWVHSFNPDLNRTLLEAAYAYFVSQEVSTIAHEKLTQEYWFRFVNELAAADTS